MTRLGCRTQARRVFRQGKGIKPHFQHTPQYFSPICRCSGMCKTSLLDVDTVLVPLVGRACWGLDNVPPGIRRKNDRRTARFPTLCNDRRHGNRFLVAHENRWG